MRVYHSTSVFTNNGIVDRVYMLAVKEAPPGWDVHCCPGAMW